jgi:hypothetical protein
LKERILTPIFRAIDIEVRRHHVEIADQGDGVSGFIKRLAVTGQPLEPGQLVVELPGDARRSAKVRWLELGLR